MRPFVGTYENKVDRKGRVSVPAKFRNVLSPDHTGIYVRIDEDNGCIEGYTQERLDRMMAKTDDTPDYDDDESTLAMQIFADSVELGLDPNGRVLIPGGLLEEVGIGETAVFVGMGRIFQIWNPEAYQVFRSQKLRRGKKTATKAPVASPSDEAGGAP